MYKYLCEGGGGGVTQIFFVFQDLKICTSFYDLQIFYLCFVRGLCTFRFHPVHQFFPNNVLYVMETLIVYKRSHPVIYHLTVLVPSSISG